jgi:hypothetical protein
MKLRDRQSAIKLSCNATHTSGHLTMAWCQLCLHEAPYRAQDLIDL